jgi:lipopolysaccharide transport system ATP-binding protein
LSDVALRVDSLGKRFRLGRAASARYRTLGEAITHAAGAPVRAARARLAGRPRSADDRDFWAIRDVGFDVKVGEVIGIVGHNGAGKSTLLRVLSRITEPTTGSADVYGRVGSLLEVGTGFHPELTGRENIFLNGAILGMRRPDIRRNFDRIVEFAEVERFIDTAVKHYSSGMYLRLAFAVAAHLESEILIVDEVLAVGDAEFQKKCLTKMREVSRQGRTILFVSHNLAAVRNICTRGLILERGRVVDDGEVNAVVDRYLARGAARRRSRTRAETPGFFVDDVEIRSVRAEVIKTFDPVEIRVAFTPKVDIQDPGVYVAILTNDHQRLLGLDFKDFQSVPPIRAGEQRELGFAVDELPLLRGSYHVEVYLKDMATHRIEQVPATYEFDVVETPVYGGRNIDQWYGSVGLHARACTEFTSLQQIAR